MHEMSIAQNIIEIATLETGKAGANAVKELELEIGMLSGVEYESLEFALKILAPGSVIENARLVTQKPEGKAVCDECGSRFNTDSHITVCPDCKSYNCSIIGGKELKVKSILIE